MIASKFIYQRQSRAKVQFIAGLCISKGGLLYSQETAHQCYRKHFLLDSASIWLAYGLFSCFMAPAPRSSAWRARHWLRAMPFFSTSYQTPALTLLRAGAFILLQKYPHSLHLLEVGVPRCCLLLRFILRKCFSIQSCYYHVNSDVIQSSDKTSVLNRKSNKLPLLIWTCILLLDSARLIKNTSANQLCHLLQETLESDDTNSLEVSQPPKSLFASLQNIFHSIIRPNLPLARPPGCRSYQSSQL